MVQKFLQTHQLRKTKWKSHYFEVGSWSTIIYNGLYTSKRWLALGFLNHQRRKPTALNLSMSDSWNLNPIEIRKIIGTIHLRFKMFIYL